MQGGRVADPSLGEIAALIRLGLIGQLAVQLLRANGCRVLAIDVDEGRVEQALAQGAESGATPSSDHEAWRRSATEGYGADFALVTAASESSTPIELAAELCRAKGWLAVVGATAMELDRARARLRRRLDGDDRIPGLREQPKERWEVSCEGRTALCENYRSTRIHGGRRHKTVNQDKGQATAVAEVLAACREGAASPFGLDELAATSAVTFAVRESVRTGAVVDLRPLIAACGGAG